MAKILEQKQNKGKQGGHYKGKANHIKKMDEKTNIPKKMG